MNVVSYRVVVSFQVVLSFPSIYALVIDSNTKDQNNQNNMPTDQTPHFTHSTLHSKLIHPSTLDATIEHCIGNFSWTQLFQATLVSFAWFFDAQQTFISIFTDVEPKWSCKPNNPSCTNQTLCNLPSDSWTWTRPVSTSIISEWSLQCSGSIITGLPASSFFLGCLVGGFVLATLADSSLGRKNMLVLSTLVMSLSGVLTSFSTNIYVYVILRFVSGFGRSTVSTCALVLATELVGKKWRGGVGVLGFVCFTFGFLSLPLVAFLGRNDSWRFIYLWTCVPPVFYSLLVWFYVCESPRWLFVKGRKDEFVETLRSMAAPTNRNSLTQSFFDRCTSWEVSISPDTNIYSAMRILLNKRWAFHRLIVVMIAGFGIGMIYYGMPLGLGNLSISLYLSVALNAASEFPASFITLLMIEIFDRKSSILGLCLLSGICSISCVLVKRNFMQIALELVSFFSTCAAFDLLLLYTVELFPTLVRNSAVSMVRQALVFGGILSPVLVAVGRKKGLMLSYGVFGLMIIVCGVFVVWLPETRGRVICDTIEEEDEQNGEHFFV